MRHGILALVLFIISCPEAFGLGQDQLYTGDAATVPPGQAQFQLYYNTTFSKGNRVSGSSLTFGATGNADVKLSYGYLWNVRGADVQLGPTVGAKWRFMGDGKRKPSVSISGLCAINQDNEKSYRKNDVGGLLIVQYPMPWAVFLGNFGHVWVGDNIPDLRYTALALGRFVTPRVLLAAQYLDVTPLGTGPSGRQLTQYVGAIVYKAPGRTGYSLQIGYVPRARTAHWNTTLGFSKFF